MIPSPESVTTEVRRAWLKELMAKDRYGEDSDEYLKAKENANKQELAAFGMVAPGPKRPLLAARRRR